MKFAIITFPGTTGEGDMYRAVVDVLNEEAAYVRSEQTSLEGFDAVLIPGGASYGSYIRPGAVAKLDPIGGAIRAFAEAGKPVLGVGDGFHILLELGLLPGAMKKNKDLSFICERVELTVENTETPFTTLYKRGQTVRLPIATYYGNYECDESELKSLEERKQIVFKYKNDITGAKANIAAVTNERGNVLGMMPHPERAVESLLGSEDGLVLFQSLVKNWRDTRVATS